MLFALFSRHDFATVYKIICSSDVAGRIFEDPFPESEISNQIIQELMNKMINWMNFS